MAVSDRTLKITVELMGVLVIATLMVAIIHTMAIVAPMPKDPITQPYYTLPKLKVP